MNERLGKIVEFCGDRLFNGAVNISWFHSDESKANAASEAFVFHGPRYHGVSQDDVGGIHGHKLIDTARLTQRVIHRCYGIEEQPFTLAIAGYGTGKSHLALTIARLLSSPKSKTSINIIESLKQADDLVGTDIRSVLQESGQPCITVTINGMQELNLCAEITKQISLILKKDGHNASILDELRPRFGQAAALIRMSNEVVLNELTVATDADSADILIKQLENQDERAYAKVYDFFSKRGMPIRTLSAESVKDVIDIVVKEYCGEGKPYRSLLILFDEFGKYTEFATVKSQIAGSGVLQDLFEGIQANASKACFVGFIQFELNAYIQRIPLEFRNEILRYITRYQSADKLYLSINLETLIASLLKKREDNLIQEQLDNETSLADSSRLMLNIAKWFPLSKNHRLWGEKNLFHSVIKKGCYPFSPYSIWVLFYLAEAGKHLQERSALALLNDAFQHFQNFEIMDISKWSILPADLWSDMLEQDLIRSEETGQQGSITHAYCSVIARHAAHLSQYQIKLLRSIVLASKLGLLVTNKQEAVLALGEMASVTNNSAENELRVLQEEYNVIEWDESFKAFDILGDSIPRTQFLAFIRQHVSASYDETAKSNIFASRASQWCDLLSDIDSDFAEENRISTREWRYTAVTSNMDYLAHNIKIASDKWDSSIGVDEVRGTIIYTFVGQSCSIEDFINSAKKLLRGASREANVEALPILVVALNDSDGSLGQALAEFATIEDMSDTDKSKFGNLVGAYKEKLTKNIRWQLDILIKNRHYITALRSDSPNERLPKVATLLFNEIYKKPIPFPFDGFNTARGNAADTCYELTYELIQGKLDYNGIIAKHIRIKNRAITVLKDTWNIFSKNGSISKRPSNPIIRSITEKWDERLQTEGLSLSDAIKQLCQPPYGANIASAGLIMGIYIAPRHERLMVMKADKPLSISQWLDEGIFKGRFISLASLSEVKLIALGETSCEWETLLDEWEQCPDYFSKIEYYKRVSEFKKCSPIPPLLIYREEMLREFAKNAFDEFQAANKKKDEAIRKIENSLYERNAAEASWAASLLWDLLDRMTAEKPLWADEHINSVKNEYIRARQYSIEFLSEWLPSQFPISESPTDIGNFNHRMTKVIGNNFKKIGLINEFSQIEKYTKNIIQNADNIAESKQLTRDVQSWIDSHYDILRTSRVAEIRGLKQAGSDYSRKLQGMTRRTELTEIPLVRSKLSEFIEKLNDTEKTLLKRATALWKVKINNESDIDEVITEIDSLIYAFDNLPADLDDLNLMKKMLKIYREWYQRLSDENLSWDSFDKIAREMQKECDNILDEEEIPWIPDDVVKSFVQTISVARKDKSDRWIKMIEDDAGSIEKMNAIEANKFYNQLSNHPVWLIDGHCQIVNRFIEKVNKRLNDLKIEWLVEKFRELSQETKRNFVQIIQELIDFE